MILKSFMSGLEKEPLKDWEGDSSRLPILKVTVLVIVIGIVLVVFVGLALAFSECSKI